MLNLIQKHINYEDFHCFFNKNDLNLSYRQVITLFKHIFQSKKSDITDKFIIGKTLYKIPKSKFNKEVNIKTLRNLVK